MLDNQLYPIEHYNNPLIAIPKPPSASPPPPGALRNRTIFLLLLRLTHYSSPPPLFQCASGSGYIATSQVQVKARMRG